MFTSIAGRTGFKIAADGSGSWTAGTRELFIIKEFSVNGEAYCHPFESALGARNQLVLPLTALGASLVGHGFSQGQGKGNPAPPVVNSGVGSPAYVVTV
ncbi:hypothetical protein CCP3SC15_3250003 [Gammaproteobacteria bacterium]